MKNLIAIDIDHFRVGIYGENYDKVFSSAYSVVKNNTWKLPFFNKIDSVQEGSEIKLEEIDEVINWGIEKRHSRRMNAYSTFGNVLKQMGSDDTPNIFVKVILSYLVANQPELFQKLDSNKFTCSLCIGVQADSSNKLKEIEKQFLGEFIAIVGNVEYTIIVENAILVPKSFCSILEHRSDSNKMKIYEGLNYIIDVNDHYINCDVYDSGELIRSENISSGIYELSDRIVQQYKAICVQNNKKPFLIDKNMIYNMVVNDEQILVVNGRHEIELSELINAEIIGETKKVLSYLIKDDDVQYADNIIMRDLDNGIIDIESLNCYLEEFGMLCTKYNNKSAKGMYRFGKVFLGDNFLSNNGENEKLLQTNSISDNYSEKNKKNQKIVVEKNISLDTENQKNTLTSDSMISNSVSVESIIEEQEKILNSMENL